MNPPESLDKEETHCYNQTQTKNKTDDNLLISVQKSLNNESNQLIVHDIFKNRKSVKHDKEIQEIQIKTNIKDQKRRNSVSKQPKINNPPHSFEERRRSSYFMAEKAKFKEKKVKTKRLIDHNIIAQLVEKIDENSEVSKYMKIIKTIDIIIAVLASLSISFSLIDNNLYIQNSQTYLNDFVSQNNITSIK